MRPIAITGIGVVSPCGIGVDAFFAGLCAEPEDRIERKADDFDPESWFGPKEARRTDRFAQLAVAAAQMALDDAGALSIDPDRSGVIIGTGIGGLSTLQEQIGIMLEKGDRRVSPFTVPMMMANA